MNSEQGVLNYALFKRLNLITFLHFKQKEVIWLPFVIYNFLNTIISYFYLSGSSL